jgi:trk system potassium uptake protein TrkH
MVRQRLELTLHVSGSFLKYLAFVYVAPLIVALYYGEEWRIFLYSLGITLALGLFLELRFKAVKEIERADAFSIVAFTWLLIPILGTAPYIFLGLHPVNAFFESMSGFTTTGSTILERVEDLPRSGLVWRSLTQWLGGMGIVTLFIAILPSLRVGGSQLFAREYPSVLPDRLRPRVKDTARVLWSIYAGFTAAEVSLLYFVAKLPLFDSVNISLCTIPSGGFTPTTASIGAYANSLAEYIIIAFMLLTGINYMVHYRVLTGKPRVLKDEEFRLYLIVIIAATLLVILSQGLGSYREALFSVTSVLTSTGFTTTDFGSWGFAARMVLLVLMFIGACGGSTTGGIKMIRALIITKHIRVMLRKAISPKAVIQVKLNGKPLSAGLMEDIMNLVFLYFVVAGIASIILCFMGLDLETAVSAVASCMQNCGPGLGGVGPAFNYAWLPIGAKIILPVLMWIGRLELFTVFMLFYPPFWKG